MKVQLTQCKLGYGGTKTEMERLLAEAMKITGKKYNLNNLAHVYEAIHVIQEELGITGTTAKEAEGTISGSFKMMEASWKNLLTAFGDPNADLGQKIDQFTDSLGKVVRNLFPVFKRIVKNIWNSLTQFAGNLGGLIFGKNEDGEVNWPDLDDIKGAALSLWNRLKDYAKDLAGLVFGKKKDGSVDWPDWDDVKEKAQEVWQGIKDKAKAIADSFGGLVFGRKEDGSVEWPEVETVWDGVQAFWDALKARALNIADTLGGLVFGRAEDGTVNWPDPDKLLADFSAWWQNTAKPKLEGAMVWTLKLFGLPQESAEQIASIVSGWWNTVVSTVENAIKWAIHLPESPHEAGEQLRAIISSWWQGVKSYAEGALNWALRLFDIGDENGSQTVNKIQEWWDQNVVPLLRNALDFTLGLFGLPSVDEMGEKIKAWWEDVKAYVGNLVYNAVINIGSGIQQGWNDLWGIPSDDDSGGSGVSHSFAKGSSYIPYDMMAKLHRGEVVLSASQARKYREENRNVDLSGLGDIVREAIQQGMSRATVQSFLNGRDITDDTNRNTLRELKSRRFAT